MSFENLYRASFYAMLVFAALVPGIDSPDNKLAIAFPFLVAAAATLAFVTVDVGRVRPVSPGLLSFGAVGGTALTIAESLADPNQLVGALGHWLIYLELMLMFRVKSVREDWEMFLLALLQVLIGTVISQSDKVGAMLFVWAILALWVLGLFSLRRDALGAHVGPTGPADRGAPGREFYPGLLNLPFLFSALRVTLTTLALGGIIFLAMPRRAVSNRSRTVEPSATHLTGFDDEVRLGQLGEILENDSVVFSAELYDEDNRRVDLGGEPLWRGVTMADYDDGRWRRERRLPVSFPVSIPAFDPGRTRQLLRQRIKLEANDSAVLFGLRPMIGALSGRKMELDLSRIDGTITRNDSRSGSFDYEVLSYREPDLPQPGESKPERSLPRLLAVPGRCRDRLKAIADREIAARVPEATAAPPNDPGALAALVKKKAEALNDYLGSSHEFGYTLKLDVVDPELDPVEDFLVNRKQGHCEYFASALTLLLRSAGIPARMVNGFKGGDYNGLAQVFNVRQKHAHSWVEAYLGGHPLSPDLPYWLTLDPTPGNERDVVVARVGGFRGNFRQITDFVRYVWVFYVVGYNAERQNRLLYAPIRSLAAEAGNGFAIMGDGLARYRNRLYGLLNFRDVRSFISVRGFVVSFVAMLLMVGLFQALKGATLKLVRWVRGPDVDTSALAVGAAHYRRLTQLLSGLGLERPPAETQEEFARRAGDFLDARGPETRPVADVPRQVVEAFYRVRFGHLDLKPGALKVLETRLDALEKLLAAPLD